ncbi:Putative P-loop containing nucleoside triphosphate hydrolases [Desulfamplus magnetovallimortis]|uniref:Putative P-loop containing nucleoside triphosphate hydrolases n=1 Tax=Desulfamplus magnetovallimortis TaxID=1246637 RepID=L0R3T6_9BACT|nr:sulfotransferase [Desulfamplus magnetovallimortis]CCO06653.1 Putative P-loop containing nucleoside triphosphate hydrolases [Desulfamplus magnetovallimortis BW-1]SLM32704.1 Putative P-loop containing nucleoside triphosphate hydrolases [Desulfamplus magnetovallimortis]
MYKKPAIPVSARIKQARFLAGYLLCSPLWAFLWYLDEFLYPEYKRKQVKPVFIMGQPRSGTTFLHRTLAEDSNNFVAIRHIEWRYPFITVQKLLNSASWAVILLQKNYWPNSSAGKIASKMHPNKLSDWEEDGIFYEECFLHHFFIFLRFPYPHLLDFLDNFPALPEHIQNKIILTHNRVIQKVLFLRGNEYSLYLSKEVTSHNKFPRMLEYYKNAKFIFSVRHSEDFMNSLFSLVRFSTNAKNGIDPINIPGWKEVFIQRMQRDSLLLRDLCKNRVKKEQQVRIMFNHFNKNIAGSVAYIYDKLGLHISDQYHEYILMTNKSQKKRNRGYEYEQNRYHGFEQFDEFVDEIETEFCDAVDSCSSFIPSALLQITQTNNKMVEPVIQKSTHHNIAHIKSSNSSTVREQKALPIYVD